MTKIIKKIFMVLGISIAFLIIFLILKRDNISNNIIETRGVVLEVDNEDVINSSVSSIGVQTLKVKIKGNSYFNKEVLVRNNLLGKKELDTIAKVGDKIIFALNCDGNKICEGVLIEKDRLGSMLLLFYFFTLVLIIYAGITGLRTLGSFIIVLIILWKVLLPNLLAGVNPLFITMIVIILLTGIIIFSVSGINKRGMVACIASCLGTLITFFLTQFFGDLMSLSGFTAPYAETLIMNGLFNLDIQGLFNSAIVIGASGASMDIAMDLSASLYEIKQKKPNIEKKELIASGLEIGKAVVGTMTTTLLLAYSGTFLTLLLLFMYKETSILHLLNLKIVAGEIMRTIVGSIGLIIVAPLTAYLGAYFFLKDKKI